MARIMEELNMSGENLTKGDEVHDGKKKYKKRKCLNGINKYGNKNGGKLDVVVSCILNSQTRQWLGRDPDVSCTHRRSV